MLQTSPSPPPPLSLSPSTPCTICLVSAGGGVDCSHTHTNKHTVSRVRRRILVPRPTRTAHVLLQYAATSTCFSSPPFPTPTLSNFHIFSISPPVRALTPTHTHTMLVHQGCAPGFPPSFHFDSHSLSALSSITFTSLCSMLNVNSHH